MESLPTILVLSNDSSLERRVLSDLCEEELPSPLPRTLPWQIETKYYKANVSIQTAATEKSEGGFNFPCKTVERLNEPGKETEKSEVQALVVLCNHTGDVSTSDGVATAFEAFKTELFPAIRKTFQAKAQEGGEGTGGEEIDLDDELSVPVRIFAVQLDEKAAPLSASVKHELLDWCLDFHFELIVSDFFSHCTDDNEEEGEGGLKLRNLRRPSSARAVSLLQQAEEEEGSEEEGDGRAGIERVREALECHMWPGLERKERERGRDREDEGEAREEVNVEARPEDASVCSQKNTKGGGRDPERLEGDGVQETSSPTPPDTLGDSPTPPDTLGDGLGGKFLDGLLGGLEGFGEGEEEGDDLACLDKLIAEVRATREAAMDLKETGDATGDDARRQRAAAMALRLLSLMDDGEDEDGSEMEELEGGERKGQAHDFEFEFEEDLIAAEREESLREKEAKQTTDTSGEGQTKNKAEETPDEPN
uniref:Uncharacterized protein n=1 Tax=Chromera velia CCMP2878 TaxID=1169474 RepID=A0A0G4G938_9ALVE|eukprot:Cvel_20820.t1-p1 / transcript=Cvel_20820.t1 / gene=Cvel_20820 / organism=Chromera_velia_CCMP2878 / gene_product=hypothetical protein / transcript_product=hypothetical protein / location=Cvel_scaffold1903:32253-35454(-) / protein_length=478 / sequence_SO=supercontig / SO=protein_coding / is_pseudo=false